MSAAAVQYVAFLLGLLFCVSSALPQNLTDAEVRNVNAQFNNATSTGRGARADITSIARLLTPDNIAQVKSLFSGFGGTSALSNVLAINPGNLVTILILAGTAVLLAPTLLSLFGYLTTASGIGRSISNTMYSALGHKSGNGTLNTNAMTINVYKSIDDFFKTYNIDAATCMQRFACTASRKSSGAVRRGNPSYVDSLLDWVLSSGYVSSTLDHTRFMDAIRMGKSNGACEIEYGKCPFSWEKVAQYLPANVAAFAQSQFAQQQQQPTVQQPQQPSVSDNTFSRQ